MVSNMNNSFLEIDYKNDCDIAYIYNGKKMINKVLDIKTKLFLRSLEEKGSVNTIAIILDRTDNLLIALLACLVGGYTYIPIDPLLPRNRIAQMLDCSDVDLIVTSAKFYNDYKSSNSALCIDEVFFNTHSFTNKVGTISKVNELAYIIYTSGTTGKPKGVEITRESLWNFLNGVSERIDFTKGKRILCSSPVSFDIFFLETVVALYNGVTIVLANDEEYQNPKAIAKLIEDNSINMIQMTPSKLQLMLNYDENLNCLKNVSEIMLGGEILSVKLLKALKQKTNARIYNMYGPTEATLWPTISELTYKEDVDIGTPISNVEIYIIDENNSIISGNEVGEIAIAGACLAKGYHNDESLTNKKFVFLDELNKRIYKTGDLGRIIGNRLFYVGRIDNQVKIRGNRIELEEIESVINNNSKIKCAVVTDIIIKSDEKALIAFIIEKSSISDKEIQSYIKEYLPSYMIPAKFVKVKDFEYTFNGKVDRKRLKEIHLGIEIHTDQYEILSFQDEILSVIKSNIDQDIFGDITMDLDILNSGIDSITFVTITVALETAFDIEFDDEMLLLTAFPTVKSIVEYVESKI